MKLPSITKLLRTRTGIWSARIIMVAAIVGVFFSPIAVPQKIVAQDVACGPQGSQEGCEADGCVWEEGDIGGGTCTDPAAVPELPLVLAPLFLLGAAGVAHRARKKKLASRKSA